MEVMELGSYNNVFINADGVLQKLINELKPSKIAVLVDENTSEFCLPMLLEMLDHQVEVIQIRSGESHKNLKTCKKVWRHMLAGRLDRDAVLINLGGGVICDLGGFCASTYMRGIQFIHMPTTLMAQADAAIGGKQGVDFDDLKNIIGVFNMPYATIIHTEFLQTLPYRHMLSGFAEIVKSALVADAEMWRALLSMDINLRSLNINPLIEKTIKIKRGFVESDPFEKNIRKALNFGHTVGHAIETHHLRIRNELLHGEAIAIGMIMESYLSFAKGLLSREDCTEIKTYIKSVFGNKYKSLPDIDSLIEIMQSDKKSRKGKIMFTLLNGIGNYKTNQEVDFQLLTSAINDYLN